MINQSRQGPSAMTVQQKRLKMDDCAVWIKCVKSSLCTSTWYAHMRSRGRKNDVSSKALVRMRPEVIACLLWWRRH